MVVSRATYKPALSPTITVTRLIFLPRNPNEHAILLPWLRTRVIPRGETRTHVLNSFPSLWVLPSIAGVSDNLINESIYFCHLLFFTFCGYFYTVFLINECCKIKEITIFF